jgi:hypothetical protein
MEITIISGEGTGEGHVERMSSGACAREIRARLTKERCGGDRWAFVRVDGERVDDKAPMALEHAIIPSRKSYDCHENVEAGTIEVTVNGRTFTFAAHRESDKVGDPGSEPIKIVGRLDGDTFQVDHLDYRDGTHSHYFGSVHQITWL